MKRLLIALVAAVAVSTGFARVSTQQGFENDSTAGFTILTGDDSAPAAYGEAVSRPSDSASYPFSGTGETGFGSSYLEIDTGDEVLSCSNSVAGSIYFDMFMQFNPSATSPTLDGETKIAVYLNAASNLVVISGNDVETTLAQLAPGTWGRLTISSEVVNDALDFKVYLNGNQVPNDSTTFASRVSGTTIASIGFKGSGKLDNFVARTTDPFYTGDYVASIGNGGEKYATLDAALADDPTATFTLNGDATTTKVLANRGDSISIELNGHSLSGLTAAGLLVPVVSTSGNVTTYTAGYFPRTATADQDGTAEHPFEVADVDDLQALSAAVAADATAFAGKCYVQTADIDMSEADAFAGIGGYAANPTEGTSFTGTYDGGNFKILNVDFTQRNYGGIFNQVNGGTIKDLTVSNITCSTYSSGEFGFAIIGNAGNGAVLTNIVAEGVFASAAQPATHNIAGIVVRASAGGTGTLIKDCVNNAALHGAYTKAAGICALTQAKVSGGVVAFDGCENNGSVSMYDDKVVDKSKHAGQDGLAGIVGYVDCNTTIKDCENAGALSSTYETAKVGQIVGWAYTKDSSSVRSLTDLGGNAAPSDARMVGSVSTLANVTGFQYATVDNGVATTIAPPYTLAKDTIYLLEGNVAASATPVFTLAAADETIAFNTNGYNFAGTVAGSSTVAVTESTSGSVITFTGVAGVAAVNDVAYATFDEAVEAVASAPEGHQYVELLADASVNFDAAGTTLAVKENAHTLTVTTTGDIAVSSTPDPLTGITTYTTADGVAQVQGDDGVWKWFGSFAEAFAYARAQTRYMPNMKFKVGSDFTPDISSNLSVENLEFIAATEDPIIINLANGNAKLVPFRSIKFPTTATLNAVSGSVSSVKGGTLNVPSGVVLELDSYATDGTSWNITGLSGSGTIKNDGKSMYYFLGNAQYNLPTRMRESSWCGTLELCGSNTWEAEFNKFANANSKVRFNGLTTPLHTSGNDSVAIELVGDGLTITGEYESARTYTVGGTITGVGALTLADNTGSLLLSGDVSGFTGNVTASGTSSAITFGSATTGSGQRIVVGGGESVTNAAGATWSAANVIVRGELVANGTMSATKLWGDSGTGVYRANNSAAAIAVASSWNGTYVIGWAGAHKEAIRFNDYGNSGSKIVVPKGSTLQGYVNVTANNTLTNNAEVVVDGVLNLSNGYDYSTVVWRKLSGSGTVRYAFAPTHWIKEEILELDRFTGSIEVSSTTQLEIESVNLSADAVADVCVVPITVTSGGTVGGAMVVKVNGTANGQTLEYKADGAEGSGLYVVAPVATVSITVPAVENATATVTTNGVDVAGDGTYTVEEGVTVTITYAPNEGYILSGTSVYTIESAAEGSTITITDTTVGAEIADVYRNDAKVAGYTSIRAAIAAAQAGDTVRLVADDTVSFEEVVVTERIPSGGSIVIDKNLTIDGGNNTVYGVSNAEILNATGSATPGLDMVADLVDGSNLIGFFVKSGNVTFNNITLTEFGDEAYVNKFGYTPIQTASAYAGSLVLTGVNFNKFNRTAVCVRGGTLTMTSGTVTANATHKDPNDHFQQPIEVRGGTATINGVNVTSDVVYSNGGGAIVAWGNATLTNVNVDFTGIGVWSDGPTVAIVGEDTSIKATGAALFAEEGGTINVSAGTFTGTLAVDSDPNSAISITGGTFDSDVNEYCASGYGAFIEGGVYVVSEAVTVTFSSAQGTAPAAQKIKKGTAVAKPADPTAEGYTFKGWTLNDAAYDFAMLVNEDITLVAQWEESQTDDWNTPASDEDVAESLDKDGITTDTEVVETVEEFNALVNYITNHVSGASAPADLSVNQKANAVLCFALNADTIPDKEITSADVTIDSVEKTGDAGAVAVTVSIAGVTPGESVPSTTLEKIVTAKGGTSLGSMSTENVTVSGLGTADGKVNITVTPKNVGSTPTSFFTSVIINK